MRFAQLCRPLSHFSPACFFKEQPPGRLVSVILPAFGYLIIQSSCRRGCAGSAGSTVPLTSHPFACWTSSASSHASFAKSMQMHPVFEVSAIVIQIFVLHQYPLRGFTINFTSGGIERFRVWLYVNLSTIASPLGLWKWL
jgi:hypothetical protein